MKKSLLNDTLLTEENWGYFRPGYYPIKSNTVVPAMVCLTQSSDKNEPDVEFVLVKANCCLKAWEDALVVSEKDYDQVNAHYEDNTDKAIQSNITDKIENFIKALTDKGYLPLNKVSSDFKLSKLH